MTKRPTIEVFMPLHFAEVNKATARMSELEECAFLRLLRDYWLNGPPPGDDATLARIVRYSPRQWAKVREGVLSPFVERSGRWVHEHTEERRNHALKVSDSKRRGSANETPNAPPNGAANAAQMHPQMRAYANVDVISNSENNYPTQGSSTDVEGSSSGAQVIPLDGRVGR